MNFTEKSKLNFVIDAFMFLVLMAMAGLGFLMNYILLPGKDRWVKYGRNVDLTLWGWIAMTGGYSPLSGLSPPGAFRSSHHPPLGANRGPVPALRACQAVDSGDPGIFTRGLAPDLFPLPGVTGNQRTGPRPGAVPPLTGTLWPCLDSRAGDAYVPPRCGEASPPSGRVLLRVSRERRGSWPR